MSATMMILAGLLLLYLVISGKFGKMMEVITAK